MSRSYCLHAATRWLASTSSTIITTPSSSARLATLAPDANFQFVQADIADRLAVDKHFMDEKPTRVIHLPAQAGVRY